MKKIILVLSCTGFFAGSAMAGSLNGPVMEEEVIIEETAAGSSANGAGIVLLLGLLLIATSISD